MRLYLPVFLVCISCISASLVVAAGPPGDAATRPTAAQIEFFEKKVRPLLADNCHKCHGPKKQKSGLRLDSRAGLLKGGETGPVLVPGDPAKSEIIAAVNYGADSFQMPPTGKLKPEQIAALTEWVKMGAPWPADRTPASVTPDGIGDDFARRAEHWSFQPVRKPDPPRVNHSDWTQGPIDRFILSRLESENLRPAPPADKRTLLRRLSYDLIGLPPTIDEINAFLEDDSPDAYERVVNRLLASPRYGERWARHWLDLVRFAETGGHEFDYDIPYAWPYRDYVIRAFNQDVPYDRFVVEHIAGDLIENPRRRTVFRKTPGSGENESVVGTAFYWFGQGKHSPVDIRAEECDTIDNQLDVLGKAFLGLTIACARCHDHKFDPIRARDYYALAGYLQSSRRELAILDDPRETLRVVDGIAKLKTENRQKVERNESRVLLGSLDRLAALMREQADVTAAEREAWQKHLRETAQRDPADLFHAWAVLRGRNAPAQFAAARAKLVEQLRRQAKAEQAETVNFADFSGDTFGEWFVSGPAFSRGPSRDGDLVWHEGETSPASVAREVLPAGLAHSGIISGRLEGTLRSPTFAIEKRYVYYCAKRVGGKPNPGRPLKNGQLHLIVDGFQYVKDPLYGGLSINVAGDGRWRWYRHDAHKFLGSRAYIEIEDADDGAIVVDRVLFSDSSPPPDSPNSLVVEMLNDPALTTPEQLAGRYRQLFAETLRLWADGRIAIADKPADRIAVVNWLLRNRGLFAAAALTDTDGAAPDASREAVLRQYRALVSGIRPPRRSLAMTDGTGENEHVLLRGNHTKPGEVVPRRFLEVLAGADQREPQSGSGRMDLARAIAGTDNPLTARVMVNRIWQHHFGRGIVASPDDFGRQGQPPSHPQLLDWLAAEFIDKNWSIKHMHRLMVLSATYRMSSRAVEPDSESPNLTAEQADPRNVLLHRMNVRRLEGEAIRDGLLAISGRLEGRLYGPGVLPFLTPFMEGRGRPGRSGPLDGDGRRSIYINVRRNFLTPMFLAFDFPTPFTTVGRRSVSNVPAQALTMMNNSFVIQQASLWAKRTLGEVSASGGRQPVGANDAVADDAASNDDLIRLRLQHLYLAAFSRPPTEDELAAAIGFLHQQGREYNGPNDPRTWADLCHVLLNVKEFVFVN